MTFNSRGNMSLRLGRGLSYRVGRKNSGGALAVAAVVLAVSLTVWLVKVAAVLLWRSCLLAVWCARWIWAAGSTLIERRSGPGDLLSAATHVSTGGAQKQGVEITRPQ